MAKPLIVVTGKNGQLGWELSQLCVQYADQFDFLFTGREELDLNEPETIPVFFENIRPYYFINAAGYTAVDKAETEQETAYLVNAVAAGLIAKECNRYNAFYIGISTDYVFDGKGIQPYPTDQICDPVNYYGYTKYMGEQLAIHNCERSIIIRTSWLYSSHGHNFVKTMLRLMKEKDHISVVNDQVGSPTYAADLANAIMKIIYSSANGDQHHGVYQYSNKGIISWYDFATAIRDLAGLDCEVLPVNTIAYPTPAKRPAYSVMDNSAIVSDFAVDQEDWKKSLEECLRLLGAVK